MRTTQVPDRPRHTIPRGSIALTRTMSGRPTSLVPLRGHGDVLVRVGHSRPLLRHGTSAFVRKKNIHGGQRVCGQTSAREDTSVLAYAQ